MEFFWAPLPGRRWIVTKIGALISPEGSCPANRKRSASDNLGHRKRPHWMLLRIRVECTSCNIFFLTDWHGKAKQSGSVGIALIFRWSSRSVATWMLERFAAKTWLWVCCMFTLPWLCWSAVFTCSVLIVWNHFPTLFKQHGLRPLDVIGDSPVSASPLSAVAPS